MGWGPWRSMAPRVGPLPYCSLARPSAVQCRTYTGLRDFNWALYRRRQNSVAAISAVKEAPTSEYRFFSCLFFLIYHGIGQICTRRFVFSSCWLLSQQPNSQQCWLVLEKLNSAIWQQVKERTQTDALSKDFNSTKWRKRTPNKLYKYINKNSTVRDQLCLKHLLNISLCHISGPEPGEVLGFYENCKWSGLRSDWGLAPLPSPL